MASARKVLMLKNEVKAIGLTWGQLFHLKFGHRIDEPCDCADAVHVERKCA